MRELIRGDVVPRVGRVGVTPWSDLPSNRILYIPLSIFAYSSNIFISDLDLIDSILTMGTVKNSRFFCTSFSFSDCTPVMKLTCSTVHPGSWFVLLSTDLKDTYCSSTTHLAFKVLHIGWWRPTCVWIPSNRSHLITSYGSVPWVFREWVVKLHQTHLQDMSHSDHAQVFSRMSRSQ